MDHQPHTKCKIFTLELLLWQIFVAFVAGAASAVSSISVNA